MKYWNRWTKRAVQKVKRKLYHTSKPPLRKQLTKQNLNRDFLFESRSSIKRTNKKQRNIEVFSNKGRTPAKGRFFSSISKRNAEPKCRRRAAEELIEK